VEPQDVERIARGALRDLGVSDAGVTVAPHETQADAWRIEVAGPNGATAITIRCGPGTTAQWVREQIFNQFQARQR
jgi:hypothetical protein